MNYILLMVFGATLVLTSCSTTSTSIQKLTELEKLADTMTGSYSSQEQSVADTAFFDIRLEMVRIWEGRDDGIWLYVEQAAAGYLDRPYRQRVYQLSDSGDGTFVSAVYTMEDPIRFAGKYVDPNPLGDLTPDSLTLREGCDIVLNKLPEGAYVGRTGDKSCSSKLRDASWATSEVTMSADRLVSWDRGWDAEGNQVWGAEKGGYIFIKSDTGE